MHFELSTKQLQLISTALAIAKHAAKTETGRVIESGELLKFRAAASALEAHIDQKWIPISEGTYCNGERPLGWATWVPDVLQVPRRYLRQVAEAVKADPALAEETHRHMGQEIKVEDWETE